MGWGTRRGQTNTLVCVECKKTDKRYSPTGMTCRSEKCKNDYKNRRDRDRKRALRKEKALNRGV